MSTSGAPRTRGNGARGRGLGLVLRYSPYSKWPIVRGVMGGVSDAAGGVVIPLVRACDIGGTVSTVEWEILRRCVREAGGEAATAPSPPAERGALCMRR